MVIQQVFSLDQVMNFLLYDYRNPYYIEPPRRKSTLKIGKRNMTCEQKDRPMIEMQGFFQDVEDPQERQGRITKNDSSQGYFEFTLIYKYK